MEYQQLAPPSVPPRFVVRNHNATVLGYFDTRATANKEAILYSAQTGNPAYVEDTQNV